MCTHRTAGRYGRFWSWFTAAWVSAFAVTETYGLVTEGSDATYSTFIRRWAGQMEPCTHSRLGRLVIVAFAAWLAAHLGWGRFGVGGGARRPSKLAKEPLC